MHSRRIRRSLLPLQQKRCSAEDHSTRRHTRTGVTAARATAAAVPVVLVKRHVVAQRRLGPFVPSFTRHQHADRAVPEVAVGANAALFPATTTGNATAGMGTVPTPTAAAAAVVVVVHPKIHAAGFVLGRETGPGAGAVPAGSSGLRTHAGGNAAPSTAVVTVCAAGAHAARKRRTSVASCRALLAAGSSAAAADLAVAVSPRTSGVGVAALPLLTALAAAAGIHPDGRRGPRHGDR